MRTDIASYHKHLELMFSKEVGPNSIHDKHDNARGYHTLFREIPTIICEILMCNVIVIYLR